MERCPSGLRCMIGNHVAGEYRHGGSNPPLSATKFKACLIRRAFLFCKKDNTKVPLKYFLTTLWRHFVPVRKKIWLYGLFIEVWQYIIYPAGDFNIDSV